MLGTAVEGVLLSQIDEKGMYQVSAVGCNLY